MPIHIDPVDLVGQAVFLALILLFGFAAREEKVHPDRFARWAPPVFGTLIVLGVLGVVFILASVPTVNLPS